MCILFLEIKNIETNNSQMQISEWESIYFRVHLTVGKWFQDGRQGRKIGKCIWSKEFSFKNMIHEKRPKGISKGFIIFKAYVYWKQGPPLLHSKKCCETCPLGLEFGIDHPSNLEAKEMVFIDFFNYEDLNVEQF